MAKQKNDYFKLIEDQVSCCVEAATLLEKLLCNYSDQNLAEQRDEIHQIEHKGDEVHHDILGRLSVEFITPIDQEDILHLVQILDDVTDSLDEVVLECYMFHVKTLPDGVPAFASMVRECVQKLFDAACELKNFKSPAKLRTHLVEVNTMESRADAAYVEAIHALFGSETDTRALMAGKAIYDCLEDCCDLCEHAADVIDQIIIKNT